jgi:peptidoglycan/xylan/chitin deacetylase (PgdA/CDA1 family)
VLKAKENPSFVMDQGAVVLSLDAELLWGHLDILTEKRFNSRYPNARAAYDHVLRSLCNSGVSATWLVVGGMALGECRGGADARMKGLPAAWRQRIPAGNEVTSPLWYRRSFVRQLANASTPQEIGLHGGLSHLIWTDRHSVPAVAKAELEAGLTALRETGVQPTSFSFPRNLERHHSLLAEAGLRCYRGAAPILSEKMGRTLPGAVLRVMDELGRAVPPPVWPQQKMPGLWNIPASMFLYPIGESRSRIINHQTRLDRFEKGIEAAARHRGVFHFGLHPVNLAESPHGYRLFDSLIERLAHARQKGDVSILTMAQLSTRMEALAERAGFPDASPAPLPGQMIGAGQY